jgi:hypothetical protein
MDSVAKLFREHFSEESVQQAAIAKTAAEILGKSIEEMTDAEVSEKIAELQQRESLVKAAELDYARGQFIGQGFLDRLTEEGVVLKGLDGGEIKSLNEKLGSLTEKIAKKS